MTRSDAPYVVYTPEEIRCNGIPVAIWQSRGWMNVGEGDVLVREAIVNLSNRADVTDIVREANRIHRERNKA